MPVNLYASALLIRRTLRVAGRAADPAIFHWHFGSSDPDAVLSI